MFDRPLVSIIMNCRNAADTVLASLQSALLQTYGHVEIIFFDSASQDESLSLVQAYCHNDPRLRIIAHDKAISLGAARQAALAHAQGKYLAFLDCDDLWHPDKIYVQVQYMEKQQHIDVLCTDTLFYGKQSPWKNTFWQASLFSQTKPQRGFVFEALVQRQWMVLSSVMLRASATQPWGQSFDAALHMAADADLFYRMALQGQCDYIPRVLTYRRLHEQNLSLQQWARWPMETRHILAKLQQYIPCFTQSYPLAARVLKKRAHFQEAIQLWRQGQGTQARKMLWQGRLLQPPPSATRCPVGSLSLKERLFYLLTFFPPYVFTLVAKWYFSLPYFLRRS